MCLMCEYYFDSCREPECVEMPEGITPQGREEYYGSRTGIKWFLHKGYSKPCKHMIEFHGPHCDVVEMKESEYGLIYEDCNCWKDSNGEFCYD